MIKKIAIFLFLFSCTVFSNYSGNQAGLFLKFNPDPKSSSLGGSFLLKEVTEGIINPASLANLYEQKFMFSHTEWAEGIKYSYLSFCSPFSFGNLGFSLSYLSYGEIQGVNVNLEEYSIPQSYDMMFAISYANTITKKVPVYKELAAVGTNLKFIKEQLAQYSAEAVGLDLATIINIGKIVDISNIETLRAALLYKNLGSKIKYVSKEYPLPASLSLAIGIDYPQLKNLGVSTGVELFDKSNPVYFLGVNVQPVYFLTLRCGYQHIENSLSSGFTGGFGINLGSIKFNYAVKKFALFSTLYNLGLVHQVSLEVNLGNFTQADIGTETYFAKQINNAFEYYYQKEYDIAKNKVEQILSLYPDYKPAQQLLTKIEQAINKQQEKMQNRISYLLKKAKVSFDRKDYITSKKCYDTVLKLDPENTDAKSGIEKINQELAQIKQQKINQQNAKKITQLWNEAVKYYTKGDFLKSKDKFNEILKIDPNHQETKKYLTEIEVQLSKLTAEQINSLYLQAVELFNKKKYQQASKYFEAVTIAAPQRLDAQEYLQRCQQAIQEEEERKKQEELAKLQQQHKKEMEEVFNNALKLYDKSDYLAALSMFEKSKQIAKKYQFTEYLEKSNSYIETIKLALSDKHYKTGYQLYQQNKLEEAYNEYSKALQYNPNNVLAENELKTLQTQLAQKYYELGISYYTSGDTEKAKECFKKSLKYMPDKEETLRALERIK